MSKLPSNAARIEPPRDAPPPDNLVPDPVFRRELGNASAMFMWRSDNSPEMVARDWPPRIVLNKRSYRSRAAIEKFKARLVAEALNTRDARLARRRATA
jgi:hypothetical protein